MFNQYLNNNFSTLKNFEFPENEKFFVFLTFLSEKLYISLYGYIFRYTSINDILSLVSSNKIINSFVCIPKKQAGTRLGPFHIFI
jgi:hypothetical protein